MRVLGIDPGLTRCGVGVVEGEVGRPLRLVDVGVVRTSADLPVAQRLVSIEQALDAWIEEHRPDVVAVERVFARSDVSTVMGTAQASGIALVCAARRGHHRRDAHPERGQGRRVRQRPGRQGPGRGHGGPDPAARRHPQARGRRRRAGARHHPHLARRRPGPHRRRPAAKAGARPDDRLREGPGGPGDPVQRRAGGRGSRPRADVHARHPGHPAHRPGRDPADQHGGPRGLDDAVRLPRRGREGHLRARADRQRRRPQARPGDAGRARPRRPAPRGGRRRRQDPHQGPRHRAEGGPADHPRAQGPARRPGSAP